MRWTCVGGLAVPDLAEFDEQHKKAGDEKNREAAHENPAGVSVEHFNSTQRPTAEPPDEKAHAEQEA